MSASTNIELISFDVAEQGFCIPISSVREIRGWTAATPMPHSPDFLLGVINLRGTIMPVVDLRRRLGMGAAVISERSVIVVIEHADRTTGLLVDAVQETLVLDSNLLQPPPAIIDGGESLVDALLSHGKVLLSRLAVDRILPEFANAIPA
jgi:purine-binding chemotaxis protein CheW